MNYAMIEDLAAEMKIPEDGTLSRTLYEDDSVKAVLFGFSAGQELSEHTASMPALLHFIEGEASLTLGGDPRHASANAWIAMPPNLTHSVKAETPTIMLLLLLKRGKA